VILLDRSSMNRSMPATLAGSAENSSQAPRWRTRRIDFTSTTGEIHVETVCTNQPAIVPAALLVLASLFTVVRLQCRGVAENPFEAAIAPRASIDRKEERN
jgi:hypothetical protein